MAGAFSLSFFAQACNCTFVYMELLKYSDIYDEAVAKDAILNHHQPGFEEDYLVLHCLLRKYQPKRFLEIGTNEGLGTMIIKNALGPDSEVFTLDLPEDLRDFSRQHPTWNESTVGHLCTLPFTQLWGDSRYFNFTSIHPINGAYIDGEHEFTHVRHETVRMVEAAADIIIWHDSDMDAVMKGIQAGLQGAPYTLYRVEDTRVSFALMRVKA